MKKEVMEYQIGKRHLANMMGEDPDFFTQADINVCSYRSDYQQSNQYIMFKIYYYFQKSIEYLFPSGLFDPKARPMMWHPDEIFQSRKAAEFDETGRPFHSMFYTYKPYYYELLYVSPIIISYIKKHIWYFLKYYSYMQNIVETIQSLNKIEDSLIGQGTIPLDKMYVRYSRCLLNKYVIFAVYIHIYDLEIFNTEISIIIFYKCIMPCS